MVYEDHLPSISDGSTTLLTLLSSKGVITLGLSLILVIGVAATETLNLLTILRLEVSEELGNLRAALNEDVDKVLSEFLVTLGVEGHSLALVTDATGAANAVDVLGDATVVLLGKVVVDDELYVLDVPTTAGDAGGDHDWALASAEGTTRYVSVES